MSACFFQKRPVRLLHKHLIFQRQIPPFRLFQNHLVLEGQIPRVSVFEFGVIRAQSQEGPRKSTGRKFTSLCSRLHCTTVEQAVWPVLCRNTLRAWPTRL